MWKSTLFFMFMLVFFTADFIYPAEPITRTVYKYGIIIEECILDGRALKRDSNGDWGYYITISHGVDFGSDIDSRWIRIEFQYFPEKNHLDFTVYSSRMSRQGEWNEVVGFRVNLQDKKMDFKSADTWQVISFENEKIKIKFKFFHAKVR